MVVILLQRSRIGYCHLLLDIYFAYRIGVKYRRLIAIATTLTTKLRHLNRGLQKGGARGEGGLTERGYQKLHFFYILCSIFIYFIQPLVSGYIPYSTHQIVAGYISYP